MVSSSASYNSKGCSYVKMQKINYKLGVSIHWTGLLDWNTGLDYWTTFLGKFLYGFLVYFKYLTLGDLSSF